MKILANPSKSVNSVAVLFAHSNSHYYNIPYLDIYDIQRDALNYSDSLPVIAHPPCRAWGRLRSMAKPRPNEKELALFAVEQVRKNGGVLEHPAGSSLWSFLDLPIGKEIDIYGGFSLKVDQSHWGHKARKSSLLYICGCSRSSVPQMPLSFDCIQYVLDSRRPGVKHLPKSQREITPPDFCSWLVDLAVRCGQ